MSHLPAELEDALALRVNPVCIELAATFACARSSNSSTYIPLEPASATAIVRWLRSKVNAPAGPSYNSAPLELKGEHYFVNFCPQLDGELVTLHRQEDALKQVGGNIWLP